MYIASATRHSLVTFVLLATIAALTAAGLGAAGPRAGSTSTARSTAALPLLPEVVVTAPRLPA